MTKQGTGSVFRRLFGLFMVVVVVIYGIIAGLFVQYVRHERRVEESGLVNRVTEMTGVIREQLRAVGNVQLQLFSDPRVAQVSLGLFPDAYERSQTMLELVEYIQSTQRINSIIDDVVLSFPQEGVELSASGGYDRKDFTDPASYRVPTDNPSRLVPYEGDLELVVAYPLPVASSQDYVPDFIIRIVLSGEHMELDADAFRGTEDEGAFWVYTYKGDNRVLYTQDPRDSQVLAGWGSVWTGAGSPDSFHRTVRVGDDTYFASSCAIPDYNLVLVAYQDADAIAWSMGKILLAMAAVFLGMGLLFLFLVLWSNRSVSRPIRTVMDALEEVRSGNLSVRIYHEQKDEFNFIYDSFNHMAERIGKLMEEVREQEALRQQAERIQLQSQIDPHFLYNSFYNIKFMARNEDYEQIETLVTALAKYYRFLNKETDALIALSGEAEHMENYIEIQQMRFGDKIEVAIQPVPEAAASFRVPKLILQPIVENAYNYGLRNVLEGGRLTVRYAIEGDLLHIDIEDNGGSMDEEKLAAMSTQMNTFTGEALNHALTNVQRRLKLTYGERSGLELAIGEERGLRVRMTLDLTVKL